MKYKSIIKSFLLLFIVLFLTSCESTIWKYNELAMDDVKKPNIKEFPLKGVWKLEQISSIENSELKTNAENKNYAVGDFLYIDEKLVNFKERYTINPQFKSKYVNFKNFISYKYKHAIDKINYNEENIKIISFYDGQQFYQDVFQINEKKIILIYDGYIFEFIKTDHKIGYEIISKYKFEYEKLKKKENNVKNEDIDTTLLIGVKSVVTEKDTISYKYKTYLFRKEKDKKARVYLKKDIFLPRKNGFWLIGTEKKEENQMIREDVFAKPLNSENKDLISYLSTPYFKKIQYVGNDFISVENLSQDGNSKIGYNIYNIDQLEKGIPLNVVEIAGEKGLQIYNETISKEKNGISEKVQFYEGEQEDKTNIGISKKNGIWEFLGSLRFQENGKIVYSDFVLNLKPVIDIFSNNKLIVPWINIKNKIQTAIDAFTSPRKNLILIQSEKELLVYELENNIMKNYPVLSVPIDEKDKIIMAEWSFDSYAESWENEFKLEGNIPVVYVSN